MGEKQYSIGQVYFHYAQALYNILFGSTAPLGLFNIFHFHYTHNHFLLKQTPTTSTHSIAASYRLPLLYIFYTIITINHLKSSFDIFLAMKNIRGTKNTLVRRTEYDQHTFSILIQITRHSHSSVIDQHFIILWPQDIK